jgi:integrase
MSVEGSKMNHMTPRSARAGQSATSDAAAGHVPETGYEDFVRRASEAKARRQQRNDAGAPPFDPDPDACAKVDPTRNPVTLHLQRQKAGKPRNSVRCAVLTSLSLLNGRPTSELTLGDAEVYPWHQIDADRARELRNTVAERYPSPASRNWIVTTVRGIIRHCQRAGLVSREHSEDVLDALRNFTPVPTTRGRQLTHSEVESVLLATIEPSTFMQVRNSAVIAVMATTGLRGIEVSTLDLSDWDRSTGWLTIRDTKNGRPHQVPVHPGAADFLESWLQLRGDNPGPLFHSQRLADRRLGTCGLRRMVQRRAASAGIPSFGLHDFRRTVASTLLRTHDAALVARLLNHRSLATTLAYDRGPAEEERSAVATLPLPVAPPRAPEPTS